MIDETTIAIQDAKKTWDRATELLTACASANRCRGDWVSVERQMLILLGYLGMANMVHSSDSKIWALIDRECETLSSRLTEQDFSS